MAEYNALELKMADDSYEYVRIADDVTPEQALDRFLRKMMAYKGDWVRVGDERYARYDRVVEVGVKRGLDDERPLVTFG